MSLFERLSAAARRYWSMDVSPALLQPRRRPPAQRRDATTVPRIRAVITEQRTAIGVWENEGGSLAAPLRKH